MQHEGVETGDLQDGTERETQQRGHAGCPGEKKRRWGGVEELGSCSEGSRLGLQQRSYAKDTAPFPPGASHLNAGSDTALADAKLINRVSLVDNGAPRQEQRNT